VAVKASDIVAAAESYLGAPYRWWTGAFPEYGPPGYMDWQNPGYYNPGFVASEGVHCSGFINLVRMECGLEPIGLTRAYEDWMWANGGESFDPFTPGQVGAICVRGWTPDTAPGVSEGHVALYVGEHELIHASPGLGVNRGMTDIETYWWAQYAVYGLMPDVDYSEAPEREPGTEPETAEVVNWFGIGADGVVRLGGDWSRGWIGERADRSLIRVYETPSNGENQ